MRGRKKKEELRREREKVWSGENVTGQVKHRTKNKRLIMEGYRTREAAQHQFR